MNPEFIAALIDAAALAIGLLVARHALLALSGGWRWSRWTARWLRRGTIVAILVPALRLMALAIAGDGDARAMLLWLAAVAILAAGAVLILVDTALAARYRRPGRLGTD